MGRRWPSPEPGVERLGGAGGDFRLFLHRGSGGLHKDSCKSGHRTWMEVLSHIIRAVFGGIILPMARLIRAVGHEPSG